MTNPLHTPQLLRGFHKDVIAALRTAADHGWTARRLADGGLIVVSPDGEQTVTFGMRKNVDQKNAIERLRRAMAPKPVDLTVPRATQAPPRAKEEPVTEPEPQPEPQSEPERQPERQPLWVSHVPPRINSTLTPSEQARAWLRELDALPKGIASDTLEKTRLINVLMTTTVPRKKVAKVVGHRNTSSLNKFAHAWTMLQGIKPEFHSDKLAYVLYRMAGTRGFPHWVREFAEAYRSDPTDIRTAIDLMRMELELLPDATSALAHLPETADIAGWVHDDDEILICPECGHTVMSPQGLGAHRRVHRDKPTERVNEPTLPAVPDEPMNAVKVIDYAILGEAITRLVMESVDLEAMKKEIESLRTRAEEAESELAALRTVLRGLIK
jgi:hypothetical protein